MRAPVPLRPPLRPLLAASARWRSAPSAARRCTPQTGWRRWAGSGTRRAWRARSAAASSTPRCRACCRSATACRTASAAPRSPRQRPPRSSPRLRRLHPQPRRRCGLRPETRAESASPWRRRPRLMAMETLAMTRRLLCLPRRSRRKPLPCPRLLRPLLRPRRRPRRPSRSLRRHRLLQRRCRRQLSLR